jgi:nucleotide-binding universal stress UspA family protein
MFERIVVGTDGSQTAAMAEARAAELAELSKGTLHIVSAYRPVSARKLEAARASMPAEFGWSIGDDDEVRRVLEAAKRRAEDRGVAVQVHATQGDPAEVIVGMAEELNADVIVIGNRGIDRRFLANVPHAVAQSAGCDVLIVRTS